VQTFSDGQHINKRCCYCCCCCCCFLN